MESPAYPQAAPASHSGWQPAAPVRLRLAMASAGLGVLLLFFVKSPGLGDSIRFTAGRKQAEQMAADYLRRSGVDPAGFQRVTTAEQAEEASTPEYFRQTVGLAAADALYRASGVRLAGWRTRFFLPLHTEEYQVLAGPDGLAPRIIYEADAKVPGAALSPDEARARAAAFLRQYGVELDRYAIKESIENKRPSRIDHSFTWESKQTLAGEAREIIELRMLGDRFSGPQYSTKAPADWERRQALPPLASRVKPVYAVILIALLIGLVARHIGRVALRWRLYIWLGASAGLLALLQAPLELPAWLAAYDTSVALRTDLLQKGFGTVAGGLGLFAATLLLAMAADTLLSARFGPLALLPAADMRAAYLREALLLGICAGLAARAGILTARALVWLVPAPRVSISMLPVQGLSSLWPAAGAVLSVLGATLWLTLLVGVAIGIAVLGLRRPRWMLAAAAVTAAVVAYPTALTLLAFVREFVYALASFAILTGVVWLLRFNVAAYMIAAACMSAAQAVASLARHPAFHWDALEVSAFLAVTAAALWSAGVSPAQRRCPTVQTGGRRDAGAP